MPFSNNGGRRGGAVSRGSRPKPSHPLEKEAHGPWRLIDSANGSFARTLSQATPWVVSFVRIAP